MWWLIRFRCGKGDNGGVWARAGRRGGVARCAALWAQLGRDGGPAFALIIPTFCLIMAGTAITNSNKKTNTHLYEYIF